MFNLPAAPPQGKCSITPNELSVLCMNMLVQDMPFVNTDEINKQGNPPSTNSGFPKKAFKKWVFYQTSPLTLSDPISLTIN